MTIFKKDVFGNRPTLKEQWDILWVDTKTEGKKQGYEKAAAEYIATLQAIETEYNNTVRDLRSRKNRYNKRIDILTKKLSSLEAQRKELEDRLNQEKQRVFQKYNISIPLTECHFTQTASLYHKFYIPFSLLDIIYLYKKAKLDAVAKTAYAEAKELYKKQIHKLNEDLSALKQSSDKEIRELLDLIDDLLKSISKEELRIWELKALLEDI